MKKKEKTPPDSGESKTAGPRVICTNSIEKPLQGGGFDRFTAGEVYDPADYDYPLGKPNFKPVRETKEREK